MYEGDGFAVAHANFAAPLGMDYIHDRFEAGSALGGGAHLLLRRNPCRRLAFAAEDGGD